MDRIEITQHDGTGYTPLVDYQSWRVAICNYSPTAKRGEIPYIERHMETDEVFVHLAGEVSLLIGKEMTEYKLEPGKVYNVKRGEWHCLCMSEDGKVLIVENVDTSKENSEYIQLK